MVWLAADDPLPHVPRRVLVAGTSGAGKTTLAHRVAGVLRSPHTEIDALFHGPSWTPREAFTKDVDRFSAEPAWVTEWQYRLVRPLLAERADTMIWLDLPRMTVMRRVIRRTLRRWLRREVLWNGNVEPPLCTIFTDPEHVIRWAWRTHGIGVQRVWTIARQRPDLLIIRLRDQREVDRWLAGPLRAAADGQGSQ
ncbi:MAG: AAA family ATPase [Pseudonocardiaceae bacterium]